MLGKRQSFRSKSSENNSLLTAFISYIRKTISQAYKPTIGADFTSKKVEIPFGEDMMSVTL